MIRLVKNILIIFIAINSFGYLQDLNFVRYLISENQFDLAKLKLYELSFEDTLNNYEPYLALTGQLSGDYQAAASHYRNSLNDNNLSDSFKDTLKYNYSIVQYKLEKYESAFKIAESIDTEYGKNLYAQFSVLFIEKFENDSVYYNGKKVPVIKLKKSIKSPHLSAVFSAFIPGSGQFYSNHYVDGIQAIFLVGTGLAFSYNSYLDNDRVTGLNSIVIGSTAMLYYANIVSGFKTALYRNIRIKQDYLVENMKLISPIIF